MFVKHSFLPKNVQKGIYGVCKCCLHPTEPRHGVEVLKQLFASHKAICRTETVLVEPIHSLPSLCKGSVYHAQNGPRGVQRLIDYNNPKYRMTYHNITTHFLNRTTPQMQSHHEYFYLVLMQLLQQCQHSWPSRVCVFWLAGWIAVRYDLHMNT